MAIRTLHYTVGLVSLIREIRYTISRMKAEPLASGYLPKFVALRDEAKALLLQEIDILEEMSDGQASVDHADEDLDFFAGRVWRTVDDSTSGNTRKQLKTSLFKGLSLSRFRRPRLGAELVAQTGWESALKNSQVPQLVALAPEAGPLVQAGLDAASARTMASQKNREFRDLGGRKQFIDKVNATRNDAHGGLSKAAFENPTLSNDFGDSFFAGEPPKDAEETLDDVKADIVALENQLKERQTTLAAMEADAANAAKLDENRKAKAQTLSGLEEQKAALEKAIADLQTELEKK
jgi:hypothetical protein